MKKRILSAALLLILIFQLSGCSSVKFTTIDKLMRPPRLYGDNSELQDAFEKSVGKDITLKAPVSGTYKSAFIFYDIDGDKDNEAFVFYTKNIVDDAVRMQVMDKIDGEWTSVASFIGSGSEVNTVDFIDMDSDNVFELIVSWNILESKGNKIFSIYRFNVSKSIVGAFAVCTEAYTIMKPMDIDTDSNTEVFFILLDATSEAPQSVARVLKMNDKKISLYGEAKLDGNVSGYSDIKEIVGKKDGIYKLYIDAYKGENQMITEVIFWNNETSALEAPFIDAQTNTNIATWRSVRLPVYDIDKDGELEIPAQVVMQGGITRQGVGNVILPFYITKWYKTNGKQLVEIKQNAVNFECKYILNFSTNWQNIISIQSDMQTKTWEVFQVDPDDKEKMQLLFIVSCVDKNVWSNRVETKYAGFSQVFENSKNATVIAASITQAGEGIGLNLKKLNEIINIFDVG